jgi:hypothetical protein
MLAHGFTAELLDRMVVEGVAATKRHRMRAGRRQIEVTWLMDRCHCHDRWSTSPGRLDARRKPHRGQAGRDFQCGWAVDAVSETVNVTVWLHIAHPGKA